MHGNSKIYIFLFLSFMRAAAGLLFLWLYGKGCLNGRFFFRGVVRV